MTPRTCPPCDGLCSQGRACPYRHQYLSDAKALQRVSWKQASPQERAALDASVRKLAGIGYEELRSTLPPHMRARYEEDESIGPYRIDNTEAGEQQQGLSAGEKLFVGTVIVLCLLLGFALGVIWWRLAE